MGCCGKISKGLSIAKGNLAVVLEKINMVPADQFIYHSVRLRACRECEHHTYLTESEFLDWIENNGGLAKFVAEIDTLEQWPLLLIEQNERPGTKLFCSLCKCWLPAKAYVKQENCPIGNPDWRKPKGLFKGIL
jgi:hypothetical protein